MSYGLVIIRNSRGLRTWFVSVGRTSLVCNSVLNPCFIISLTPIVIAQPIPIVISSAVEKSKQLHARGSNGWLFRADEISPLHSLSLVPVEMTEWGCRIVYTYCHFERSREIQAITCARIKWVVMPHSTHLLSFRAQSRNPSNYMCADQMGGHSARTRFLRYTRCRSFRSK